MKKIVVIVGDDKLGRQAAAELLALQPGTAIYLNRSVNALRLWKLLRHNPWLARDLLRMFIAELGRKEAVIPRLPALYDSAQVLEMIAREKPDTVICFRAGLIFGKKILNSGPQFLNLHYADLPQWGGLGAIARALRAGAFQQNACLHEMQLEIDAGKVLARQPYTLDPKRSYKENEEAGFAAGMALLTSILKNP